ncbi:MAG: metallophosphoesterase [Mesorhizobium sp.]|uniref:metallophosphoesterase family protein n=1 Tax=Mesorhizobium sp. TaxID=1871066 RepID=UPI00121F66CF|nr:metallophosphoesterase [Mesorhizobium sp.]TIP72032.1 MAG: metallophosphoesterase [Mesorhizobium sp.]TIR48884.1 MAG: metallophosphoesterase [Mesorhizobium sp.]TJV96735.1 MAG: metallophosphoesterase [Mesorhizobium sp.]
MTKDFETFRDPLLSLFQSAAVDVGKKIDQQSASRGGPRSQITSSAKSDLEAIATSIARRERGEEDDATPAARDLSKLGIARACAEWGLRYLKAVALGNQASILALEDEFTAGTCDPAWLGTLREYRSYFDASGKRKPIPYIRPAQIGAQVIEIKADASIGLLADWGTGARPAVEVLKALASDQADVLVHLGDIYYSGTPSECAQNFLQLVNLVLRQAAAMPVFTLSGNHDMYCGGVGFYDLIKQLNPSPFTQPASFFCLRSADENWQLLAMDTGLHDDNPSGIADALTYLEDDELEWHCDRIREFPGRTILLSHHPLFSAFSAIGAPGADGKRTAVNRKLLTAFERLSAEKAIAAWFWGHEHNLAIYNPFAGLARGRCVGHGAVPVSVLDQIYEPVGDLGDTPTIIPGTELGKGPGVYNHGYAMLAFRGKACRAEYFEVAGGKKNLIFGEDFE